MSNTFKKKYTSFNRDILAEFLSEKELRILDKAYNQMKIIRGVRKLIQKESK